MFESFGFESLTPVQASLYLALALGVAFGVLAEITRFCLRRALVSADQSERRAAGGVWLMALTVALIGTQAGVSAGLINFDAHRFLASDLPVLAIVLGGLAFGAGMVLTRGCASRLAVLTGSGNLRAGFVLVLFAIAAHATLKGVLAPLSAALASVTLPLGSFTSLAALPGGALPYTGGLALTFFALALRSGASWRNLALAVLIGLIVPAAWLGTGYVLYDEFDPIVAESLSLTAPATATLFWAIASTSIAPGFGVGIVGGILAGAAVSALAFKRFAWVSFESPAQTGRYTLGAILMGVGGVLAGGCTLGAGLSGIPTLGFSAFLALAAIIAGAKIAGRVLNESGSGSVAQPSTQALQPAE
ncbi:YeeE/YedE family protein [Lentibacter sp. XHP0401]|uniref:YeeE/YedE family protein n=1 Tax=Lentibacter sp. XHP0401 TaxID=2984334 RepID=UPI0021E99D19|nr:YeeE/YedE family protein [Lentibacter sp. XHP0401]MCV2893983.1 YeeE/YedE family protein [Lentibacter sp. XHP0401]